MRLGIGELIVVLVIVLLVFGARRLPELGRSLGQAIQEFQRAVRGNSRDGDSSKKKDRD